MFYFIYENSDELYTCDTEEIEYFKENGYIQISEEDANILIEQKEIEYRNSDEYKKLLSECQEKKKRQLLAEVKEEIEILQDTIDFDEHDDGDEAHLLALKKYRVALNKVDTSVIDCEFPEKPVR